MPSTGAKVLTVNELSEYLRVHRSTIYRLLKKGQLPGFKIGSDWRFNVEAIDQWRLQQGAAQPGELRAPNKATCSKERQAAVSRRLPQVQMTAGFVRSVLPDNATVGDGRELEIGS